MLPLWTPSVRASSSSGSPIFTTSLRESAGTTCHSTATLPRVLPLAFLAGCVSSKLRCRWRVVALQAGNGTILQARLEDLSLKELKEYCRARSLKVSGSRASLLERLKASGFETTSPIEAPEGEEISQAEQELMVFTTGELRQLCFERQLITTGRKLDLVKRITSYQDQMDAQGLNAVELPEGIQTSSELTPSDKLVAALRNDELDVHALEAIFNMQMPQPGEIVRGVVTNLMEWGAFVELEPSGWSGMIHVSEICDEFVDNIEDYLRPGHKIEALVIKAPHNRIDRLALSIRRLKYLRVNGVDPKSQIEINHVANSLPLPCTTPKPNPVKEEDFLRLKVRVNALEALLIQLGHGQALRRARFEAEDGVQRTLPTVDALLDGIPHPESREALEIPRRESRAIQNEKKSIDALLTDLFGGNREEKPEEAPKPARQRDNQPPSRNSTTGTPDSDKQNNDEVRSSSISSSVAPEMKGWSSLRKQR